MHHSFYIIIEGNMFFSETHYAKEFILNRNLGYLFFLTIRQEIDDVTRCYFPSKFGRFLWYAVYILRLTTTTTQKVNEVKHCVPLHFGKSIFNFKVIQKIYHNLLHCINAFISSGGVYIQ